MITPTSTLRLLAFAVAAFLHITNTNAQYVQTALPLRDTVLAGIDLQAHDVAISADGGTAVAGYPNNDNSSGAFVIYQRSGNSWVETFSYYNTGTERSMGAFVAISGDGNTVVVTGADKLYWIYVRQGNTWQLQRKSTTLSAGLEPSLSFDGNTVLLGGQIWVRNNNQWAFEANVYQGPNTSGYSGKISADGNTVIINRYISVRQGNNWVQQGAQLVPHFPQNPTLSPSGYAHNIISGDGNTCIVAFYYSSFSNYLAVFRRTGSMWMQETLLTGAYLGGSTLLVSHNGNNVLFVARSGNSTGFRFWKCTQGAWSAAIISTGDTLQPSNNGTPYLRADMDSSGTQALVCNRFSKSLYGGLRYYTLSGLNWQLQGSPVFNSQVKGFSWQGTDVAISLDGSTMVSSGINEGYGAVWTHTRSGNKWVVQGQPVTCPEATDGDRFFAQSQGGRCLSLSANGNTMAVSAIYDETPPVWGGQYATTKGAVYIFSRVGGVWQFAQKLTVPYDSNFIALDGGFVKLSNDGLTLLVSSYNKGGFVFAYNGSSWQLQQNLPSLSNAYTTQADLSGDGNTIAMVQKVSQTPRLYVYKRTGSTWQMVQGPITPPATSQPNLFPVHIRISNNGNVIGMSDIYSYPDKIYFLKDSAGTFVKYGNTCDSTCGGYNIHGGGGFGLSTTGDTVYSIITSNLNTLELAVDVYVKHGNKWVYVYTGRPDEQMVIPVYGNYVPDASVAVSGDLKYMALGYPYRDGGEGGIYPFVQSSLNVSNVTTHTPCPGVNNGKIRITVTGGVAPVTISWSTGATGVDSLTNLAAGNYRVTITDADAVELVREYTIAPAKTMQVQNISTNYNCSGNTGHIAVSVNGGTAPYSFVWNTNPVQTNDTAFNVPAGTYAFTVTDSAGCTYTDTTELSVNAYWSNVTANNPGCVNNNGSATMQLYGGIAPYSYEWNNGDTTATVTSLAPGIYHVTATDGNECSVTDSVTLTATCVNVVQGHLFFDTNNNCVQDSGEVNAANYNLYADGLTYYTYGNTDAQGNYSIMVPTPGSFLVKIGNWSSCGFNVCSGDTNPFPVTFTGIGDTVTGADFALVDTTYDLTLAVNSPVFNPGFAGNVGITYYNSKGNVVPNASITITYDSLLTFNSTIPAYTTHNPATRTLTYNVGNVGPADTAQHITLNLTLATGVFSNGMVNVNCLITPTQNDCNSNNNEYEWLVPVAGAYDPNAKSSSTDGRIGFADTTIDYTIHFQNTGNDTTHFIVITDTLPDYLDPASVQTMATSHKPYTYTLSGDGIVEWRFDPIYLPDSTTDEPNSHGYVTFRVRVANSPANTTTLKNKAHIYFDYNDAIVTNTTVDTVVCKVNGATKQASICTNQSYNFNGKILTTSGTYKTAYRSKFNCDSIVTLVLTVNSSANPAVQVNAATCKGQPYSFYGSTLSTAGTYTASLPAATGCDTIVTLNLQVYDTAGPVINASICKGESYPFDGNNLTVAGTYLKHLQGANCDSVVTLNLQVRDTSAPGNISAAICSGESYTFDGNSLTTAGTYTMHLQNGNGCDSAVVLALSVNSVTVTATLTNDTLYAAGAANYTWINCSTGNTLATGNSYKPLVSGNYAAVADANSCTDTSNCVTVLISGVQEIVQGSISVYPNPFTNTTTITVSADIPQYSIQLYDITGRVIATHTNQNTRTFTLHRDNIAAGAYLLKVINNGIAVATVKLIVE